MAETTVFQSGNSQAVRLPKEFRFKSKTVEIFRRGDEVVLREKPRMLGALVDELFAKLPQPTVEELDAFDRALAEAREDRPERERDWDALFGEAPPAATATGKRARRPRG